MASAPPAGQLPLLYNKLEPLSSSAHADFKVRPADHLKFISEIHAIPLTVDEFVVAQRHYPIVFSSGENSVPLALMGLNEGANTFVDENGKLEDRAYPPAYVRRYPFMLAKLRPDAEELSLCFDRSAETIGAFDDGNPLFEDGKPTELVQSILKYCEEFEISAQRTNAFVKELKDNDLLIEGEVTIQPSNSDKPFIYRGFQMVAEERLREMRGDTLRKLNQNGALPLITAHLFSLSLTRDIFAKQVEQGKGPKLDQASDAQSADAPTA